MMDIGTRNVRTLEAMNGDALDAWFQASIEGYFDRGDDVTVFQPLDVAMASADGIADGFERSLALMGPAMKARLRKTLERTMRRWRRPDPDTWAFFAELAWRLGASDAMAALEARCSDAFLDAIVAGDLRRFRKLLSLCRAAAAPDDGPSVRFIRRLAASRYFADSQARVTLVRLCEIDPDQWAGHVAALRDKIHQQMVRILEQRGYDDLCELCRELACDIYGVIGFERFVEGLDHLSFGGLPPNPFSSSRRPCDDWLIDGLLEAGRIVVDEGGQIADADRPADLRAVPEKALVATAGEELEGVDLALGAIAA